jgi:hypothetical protein
MPHIQTALHEPKTLKHLLEHFLVKYGYSFKVQTALHEPKTLKRLLEHFLVKYGYSFNVQSNLI